MADHWQLQRPIPIQHQILPPAPWGWPFLQPFLILMPMGLHAWKFHVKIPICQNESLLPTKKACLKESTIPFHLMTIQPKSTFPAWASGQHAQQDVNTACVLAWLGNNKCASLEGAVSTLTSPKSHSQPSHTEEYGLLFLWGTGSSLSPQYLRSLSSIEMKASLGTWLPT